MAALLQHDRSRHTRGAASGRWSSNLVVVPALLLPTVLPFGRFWPVAHPAEGVLPRFLSPGFHVSDGVVLALLITALLRWRGAPINSCPRWLLPLFGLCVLGLASLPGALSQPVALRAVARWILATGACIALISARVPTRRLALTLCLGLGLQVAVELLQLLAQGPVGVLCELQLAPNEIGASILEVGHKRWVRPYGLTFHPNVLGGFLGVGLVVGLPLIGEKRWFGALWTILVFGWLSTFSRSAWFATAPLALWLIVWLALRYPQRRAALGRALPGAAIATVFWLVLFPQQVAVRVGGAVSGVATAVGFAAPPSPESEQRSLQQRAVMNDFALQLAKARPMAGVGAGNFPLAMKAAAIPVAPQFAHNVPLLLAAEVGVTGAFLWIAMTAAAAIRLMRPGRPSPYRIAAVCGVLVLAMVSLFDSYPWALDEGRLLLALLLAMASAKDSAPQMNGEVR